jgi:acetoin utilization deacetylase AcuC-like enzyme
MWAQAQPVFNNLVAELTAHTGNAVQLVSQAVLQLTSVLANGPNARFNILDTIISATGLGNIWSAVQSVGNSLYTQLVSLMTQLVFAGQQMWTQAMPVFNNLVAELTAHTGNAVQLVSQAVLQLTSVLANGPQRSAVVERIDLIAMLSEAFNLGGVISTIQSVGTGLYSQLVSLMTQLVFAGQQMWAQATPVFNNLVAELTAHTGNAVQLVSQAVLQLTSVLANGPQRFARASIIDSLISGLGLNQVWSLVQSVGTGLYSQLLSLMTQLVFAGQNMWAQAQPVFNNLVAELTAHTGNAVQLVSQAVLQLTSVLASGPARSIQRAGLLDTIINATGLNQIWSAVQSVGTSLYSQFLGLLTQLLFAGQQMWAQATPVFNNLVAELTAHTGNAVQLVSQAVLQLTSVLANGPHT